MTLGRGARATKAKLFRGLSDESRLLILESLTDGPKTVGELVLITQLTQPNVSNHLSCLKRCGLVTCHQNGRFVTYELNSNLIKELLSTTDRLLDLCASQVDQCDRYSEMDRV